MAGSTTSRRTFLKAAGATALGLALGPRSWAWASGESPFGPLQDDPHLRLPEGFTYRIVGETGMPLLDGPRKALRPHFPDLNVVFPQGDGKVILSTSHETPKEFPLSFPVPGEDYDRVAGGAVTSLLLSPDLEVLEGAYNAGGMLANCSGSGTPWGTVLTGEESTATLENAHGYVWEVDIDRHVKRKLAGLGKFDHETAVVHGPSGRVYLTEDADPGFLYRFEPATRPSTFGDLAGPGTLQAYTLGPDGSASWVSIDDPEQAHNEAVAKGALGFSRLEGGAFDPFEPSSFYFTETADPEAGGRVWRLDVDTDELVIWARGAQGGSLRMPDNLAFDAAGNLFLCEDAEDAALLTPNRVVFVDRETGAMATFAELVQHWHTPSPPANLADEFTGSVFWHRPDGSSVFFLNLQRAQPWWGVTVAIEGPFAGPHVSARRSKPASPSAAR